MRIGAIEKFYERVKKLIKETKTFGFPLTKQRILLADVLQLSSTNN